MMATNIKSIADMSVKELKRSEEKYKLYMEGQRQRIWQLNLSVFSDFGHSIDAFRYAVQQLKDIKFPEFRHNTAPHDHCRIVIGGSQHGKTALMEAMMKDLHKHGVAIHVAKERLGSIEHTHVTFDSLTWGLNFDSSILKDIGGMAVSLPEKIQDDPLDLPENWLSPEPPKRKKFRAHQVDKRALNRKNRKRK